MRAIIGLSILLLFSCSVPRVMHQSGRVTEKGTVTGGFTYMANVSQVATTHLTTTVVDFAKEFESTDSVEWGGAFENSTKALMAYSVDPLAYGMQFYVKYGLMNRMDLGYLRAGKANLFETNYQFLGPVRKPGEPSGSRFYGSAGLRYSWSKYSLPDYLGDIQSRLGYSMKRKDLMVPITLSYSFGPDEDYGSISAGAVFGWHFLNYGFFPDRIYDDNGLPLQAEKEKNRYNSFGFFLNTKVGYRYFYVIPSLSVYHQNFGNYPLLNNSYVALKGWSFVPAITFQIQTPKRNPKKKD